MVALLDLKDTRFVETKPVIRELEVKAGHREWQYAMPFAGVKYYTYPQVAQVPRAVYGTISAPRLIDERVILL